jgi:hypothetical protein
MKKYVIIFFTMIFALPLHAATNPTVALQTISLGFPFTQPFTVNAVFSEAVVGFGVGQVSVTNGTVIRVTGSNCQPNYVITVQAIAPGPVKIVIPANAVVSLGSGLPNAVSNVLSISGLNPSLPPASNIDLRQWNLTLPLPLDHKTNAVSIGAVTLTGTPSLNNGYSNPPYFFTDPVAGSMSFMVPLNGATTPGSNYSRCELREVLPGAVSQWKLSTFASNTLTASLRVSHVPPIEKRFVIGQIHDDGKTDSLGHIASNSPLVKLYYDANALDPNKNPCNGCVYGQVRQTPSQSNFLKIVSLIQNIPLETLFRYQVRLLRDGTLTITANQSSTTIRLSSSTNNTIGWGSQSFYFKAGAYNLEHDSVEGGADSFYSLQVSHQ